MQPRDSLSPYRVSRWGRRARRASSIRFGAYAMRLLGCLISPCRHVFLTFSSSYQIILANYAVVVRIPLETHGTVEWYVLHFQIFRAVAARKNSPMVAVTFCQILLYLYMYMCPADILIINASFFLCDWYNSTFYLYKKLSRWRGQRHGLT